MLAILEEWAKDDICHVDNTSRYLFVVIFKLALDTGILRICWHRLHTNFLSMCSLSVILVDVFMVMSLTLVWFLNPLKSPVSVCFLLSHFSVIFSMVPVPMLGLGLLDYLLQDRCPVDQRPVWKLLRNTALALLIWLLAGLYSYETTSSNEMEMEHFGGLKALVCEVQRSLFFNAFVVLLLILTICSLLPHYSAIPAWYRKANRLSEQRDQPRHTPKSDLLHKTVGQNGNGDAEARDLLETAHPPSLSISLMLGFSSIWLPYLLLSAFIACFGLGIPAYITINLMWLECTNSLLVGCVFWLRSNELGQYTHLPDNICSWRTFLQLSRGTHAYQENFEATIWKSSDSKTKINSNQFDHAV
ncbi:hypothetical protein NHX12_013417 [Muraenolepis orangiensis]|uniref:Uncharacterized protein n=1 Tax=Muraenolepis orangiensis TaxID=630683 RepID=A0A9Q0DG57_9TELE|nr:hypothetical protein NHX12_013417 [Muraenolepis orangiensis]